MFRRTEPARLGKDIPYQTTHLFLVRVWLAKHVQGTDAAKLCGRVQDVSTAHALSFRGGAELETVMLSLIPQAEMERSPETAKSAEHANKA